VRLSSGRQVTLTDPAALVGLLGDAGSSEGELAPAARMDRDERGGVLAMYSSNVHFSETTGRTSEMKRTIVMFTAIALGSLLAACSASSTTGTPTPTSVPASTPTSTPVPTPTPTATPTAAPVAVAVAGKWSGTYSGYYNGTFTLTWNQSGSHVSGSIVLSSPARTLRINGSLAGSAITFGAVGSVTYTGTVSGSSMSGTYTVVGGAGGGSWSANKS
jgi:hypothetical protein